ncbi:MAG: DNA mismatch repair protein MutS [Melioribacteraceae bacterium]|nr:MAG: DNA mismatch repair protein MutS [Melioribacteraceae bacterium]
MAQTPLMAQYYKVKEQNPDTVLLFRVGDFFETFEDDAKTASKVLGITLTKRSNGAAGDTPLAGFPHHAIDTYLPKLVRAGYRVAVCEQVENPKLAKGIVKREVTEVVTPGVAFSDKLLDHKKNNYLLSVYIVNEAVGFSFSDISTGEFYTYVVPVGDINNQFGLINPSEVLISKKQKEILEPIIRKFNPELRITKLDDWLFGFDFARDIILDHFKVKTLKGFGIEKLPPAVIAAGSVLNYLKETQKANLPHLNNIALYNPSEFMILDTSTKRNLEITYTMMEGDREGSLISILDHTETPMGGRLLKKWISAPLRKVGPIIKRQECVESLVIQEDVRDELINHLKEIGDLERLTSKVCTGRINPRELVNLKGSLNKIPKIKDLLAIAENDILNEIKEKLAPLEHIVDKIEVAISDEPPLNLSDGGIIREGFSPELDELRSLSKNAKTWISNLQKSERERASIPSLKVNYNKVFGYYIEISNAHKDKVPENYIRKQTLVNSERYITPELKEYEDKVLNAEENIAGLEAQIYNEIRNFVAAEARAIQENARLLATLDCFSSFAVCAVKYKYVRPVVDDSGIVDIKKGRHPVVEQILPPGEKFTANDVYLDNGKTQIIVLTGPNMAGKSVYLRQTGLLVLMAQIGSFVPAESAVIGVIDRIYTRVGASDNISAGESTFLVEMQEAANILNNATDKSLILLDEIGRGTSTFDGISIAWAITEYLHENPNVAAKTLFATHYHELNELSEIFPRIKNFKVEVREYEDKVIFLHKVSSGGADLSYGIQVAQMAGLPGFVTKRAKEILSNLEGKELTPFEIKKAKINKYKAKRDDEQFSLFEFTDDRVRKQLSDIKIEDMTPLDALNKLSELKKQIESDQ